MKKEEILNKAKQLFENGSLLHRDYKGHQQMLMNEGTFIQLLDQQTSALRQELEKTKEQLKTGQDAFVTNWDMLNDAKQKISELEKENASLLYDTMKDESIGLQSEIVDLNSQLRSAQVENERLEKAFSFINNACDERDKKIQSLSARVGELEKGLKWSEGIIKQQNEVLESNDALISNLLSELTSKDKEIERLKNEKESYQRLLNSTELKVGSLDSKIESFESSLLESEAKLKEQKEVLKECYGMLATHPVPTETLMNKVKSLLTSPQGE